MLFIAFCLYYWGPT